MHDLANLRSLLAVAEAGAITEAAHRLGLTQPALTRRIQQLEAEFGTALLQRGRNGATLTEAGRRGSAYADRTL
jgi:DNA-binding transcriptional LysR family regulator